MRGNVRFIIGPLLVLLVLWLWLFSAEGAFKGGPSGKAFAADFAMFVGGAQILQDGGNPYDHALLYRTERAYLAQQGLPILSRRAVVRVGNPPLFFWVLAPFVRHSFQPEAYLWMALLYILSATGFLALLRYLGWRRWKLPLFIFLLMPEVALGPFYGNVIGVVFCCIAFALLCLERHPAFSGVLLTAAWLKPPAALPIVLLILLFHAPRPKAVMGGFLGGTALLTVMMVAVTGPTRMLQWLNGMIGYSRDLASSPAIASLTGLYAGNVPTPYRTGIEALSLIIAVVLTALAWHRLRREGPVSVFAIGWLWVLWFLATPYAHFFDAILLTIPIAATVGRDGMWATSREGAVALYLAFAALLVISATPLRVQLLWLPILGILLVLRAATVRRQVGELQLILRAAS